MSKSDPPSPPQRVYREMTVALLRDRTDAVEVAFSESARFFLLWRKHPEFASILRQLRDAKATNKPVSVLLDEPQGNVINDVRPAASPAE